MRSRVKYQNRLKPSKSNASANSGSSGTQMTAIPPDEYYGSSLKSSSDKQSVLKSPNGHKNSEKDSGNGDIEDELHLSSISCTSHKIIESINTYNKGRSSLYESDSESYTCCSSSCCCTGSTSGSSDMSSYDQCTSRNLGEVKKRNSTTQKVQVLSTYELYLRRIDKLRLSLEKWDRFMKENGVTHRNFFCRFKEREALQQIVDEFQEISSALKRKKCALQKVPAEPLSDACGGVSITSRKRKRNKSWRRISNANGRAQNMVALSDGNILSNEDSENGELSIHIHTDCVIFFYCLICLKWQE